jgi:hypothetical protein
VKLNDFSKRVFKDHGNKFVINQKTTLATNLLECKLKFLFLEPPMEQYKEVIKDLHSGASFLPTGVTFLALCREVYPNAFKRYSTQ